MARLVMKFGGTSVADTDRIRNVARHVKREIDAGHEVAVVVSAMSGTTDQLITWCEETLRRRRIFDAREYDAVVATGLDFGQVQPSNAMRRVAVPSATEMFRCTK